MTLLTIEYKLVSVEYFLDSMQLYELPLYLENINISVKNDWTIAREVMWSNLKPWVKGNIKPEKLITFPWEKKNDKLAKIDSESTKKMIERMKTQESVNRDMLMKIGVL